MYIYRIWADCGLVNNPIWKKAKWRIILSLSVANSKLYLILFKNGDDY